MFVFLLFKLVWTITISVLAVAMSIHLNASAWATGVSRRCTFSLLVNTTRLSHTGSNVLFASVEEVLVLRKQTLISGL